MVSPTRILPTLAVIAAAGAVACATAGSGARTTVSSSPPMQESMGREQTADQQILHVLNRLSFGATPGDVARVRAMGVDAYIEEQLHPERIPNAKSDQFLATYEIYDLSTAELAARFPQPVPPAAALRPALGPVPQPMPALDSSQLRRLAEVTRATQVALMSGRVARAVLTDRQLQEVMTDFWLNHFSIYAAKGPPERYLLPQFENTIRANALGNFRTLLGAVAKSPAMLFYLDNWQSQADTSRPTLAPGPLAGRGAGFLGAGPPGAGRAGAPPPRRRTGLNENYARELMELHTLGVDGGYTQQDVINVARAFTGWGMLRPATGAFAFIPVVHDAGEKTVLGHTLAAGRGIQDGEDVLDIVAHHPATAHYIALKLARRFVSDNPPPALVDRAAATFTRTDGDIRETLRTILESPEFFSEAAYQSKVKSPFEVAVSALRALGAAPDPTVRTATLIATLGEPVYGHEAPNGWPEIGEPWMSSGAILNRINFGIAIGANRVPGVSATQWPGAAALRSAPMEQQVDGVIAALLGGHASPETRSILLSGENPLLKSARPGADAAMAGGMIATGDPPDRTLQGLPPLTGLAQIVGLAIGSPEFQRR